MADNSQQALAELQQAQTSARRPEDILSSSRQSLGVNSAEDQVKGLRGAINSTTKLLSSVAPSVMGRTGNSLVTSAQAGRIVQNEQAPIAANLDSQNRDYGVASEDLNRLSDEASQNAQLAYGGEQQKISYLQNLYNTLYQREQDAQAAAFADKQLRASSAASGGGGGFDLSSLFDTPTATGSTATKSGAAPNIRDQAYKSVQQFLQGNEKQILSDYAATLKSANYGNALDKLKVELYKQARPDLFSPKPAAGPAGRPAAPRALSVTSLGY